MSSKSRLCASRAPTHTQLCHKVYPPLLAPISLPVSLISLLFPQLPSLPPTFFPPFCSFTSFPFFTSFAATPVLSSFAFFPTFTYFTVFAFFPTIPFFGLASFFTPAFPPVPSFSCLPPLPPFPPLSPLLPLPSLPPVFLPTPLPSLLPYPSAILIIILIKNIRPELCTLYLCNVATTGQQFRVLWHSGGFPRVEGGCLPHCLPVGVGVGVGGRSLIKPTANSRELGTNCLFYTLVELTVSLVI